MTVHTLFQFHKQMTSHCSLMKTTLISVIWMKSHRCRVEISLLVAGVLLRCKLRHQRCVCIYTCVSVCLCVCACEVSDNSMHDLFLRPSLLTVKTDSSISANWRHWSSIYRCPRFVHLFFCWIEHSYTMIYCALNLYNQEIVPTPLLLKQMCYPSFKHWTRPCNKWRIIHQSHNQRWVHLLGN